MPTDTPAPDPGQESQAAAPGPSLIQREEEWRQAPPAPLLPGGRPARITIARWSGEVTSTPVEASADTVSEHYMISRIVRRTNIALSIGRKVLTDGDLLPGSTLLTNPDLQQSRAAYRQDFDVFRVFIPRRLLAECLEAVTGRSTPGVELFAHHETDDHVLHHLTMSLLSAGEAGGPAGAVFLDSVGLTLAMHLVSRHTGTPSREDGRRPSPLVKWRLNRVVEHIEANLARDMSLAELSAVAGLSRMHFAAQFKAATGASPHSYILQRRVAASKLLLAESALPVQDVAHAVGFKTLAHFVNVFRRQVGESPGRWRESLR